MSSTRGVSVYDIAGFIDSATGQQLPLSIWVFICRSVALSELMHSNDNTDNLWMLGKNSIKMHQ